MGVLCRTAALLAEARIAARARVLAALGVTKGACFTGTPTLGVATALNEDGKDTRDNAHIGEKGFEQKS